jgi:hypothetical protein
MKIALDVITIETADLAGLSKPLAAALQTAVSARMANEEYLSILLNSAVASAVAALSAVKLQSLAKVASAIVVADSAVATKATADLTAVAVSLGTTIGIAAQPVQPPIIKLP